MLSRFEDLPNELLLDVFQYTDTRDLYRGFWGLNTRLNHILQSLKNLSVVNENNDVFLAEIFASRIVRLEVTAWHEMNLSRFPNLHSLILRHTTRAQVLEIQPDVLPHLVYLSLSVAIDFWTSSQLAQNVFSNEFPSLRYVDLGRVDIPYTRSWSLSPRLRSVTVCSSDPIIVPLILASCPRLLSLQAEIFGDNHRLDLPSFRLNHPLRRLTFADSYGTLSLNDIDRLLAYVPNLEHIHLTLFEMSFSRLAHSFVHYLHRLRRFDCCINEPSDLNEDIAGIDTLREMHPCFNQLKYFEGKHGMQHFTNRRK